MAVLTSTPLPNDFVNQVLARLKENGGEFDDVQDAILAVLHRPLTLEEKLVMVDHAAANSPGVTLDQDVVYRIGRGGIA